VLIVAAIEAQHIQGMLPAAPELPVSAW